MTANTQSFAKVVGQTGLRKAAKIFVGMETSDGAGVRMRRYIGSPEVDHLDPFLLFDVFKSDRADDYIAGFPAHPHRGFETVTYMFSGRMRHKDNAGHEGVIGPGGVQWMTAGKGIIHSEMPEQEDGLMWGTQLWVNLPKEDKMTQPSYLERNADQIPTEHRSGGVTVKLVAGNSANGAAGAVQGRPTDPLYLDVSLPANQVFQEPVPSHYSGFVFVVDGEIEVIGPNGSLQKVTAGSLAILGGGSALKIAGGSQPSRLLLVAAKALNEPVARAGPFVMNTRAEVLQAFQDFERGNF